MKKTNSHILKKLALLPMLLLAATLCVCAQQRGKASYYSHRLHGVRMSDGSKYHRDSLTCAHKTYPLGTTLRVRNVNNDKEVYVKVTDRGPHCRGRIVDLSYAAAKELDMLGAGVASVEVEQVDDAAAPFRTEQTTIPMLKLVNPSTGSYMTMAEAKENMEKKLESRTNGIASAKMPKIKKVEPRYRILRNTLSAKKN